jgi:L-lysine exporter family protein LysE/ArgO
VTFSSLLLPALFGMGTGLALIVAIGAQNAYVLKIGLQGVNRVVLPVIAVCAVSDAVLIIAGVAGVGALIAAAPQALVVVRIVGAAFLLVYAGFAAKRAIRPPGALQAEGGAVQPSRKTAVVTVLALTWLNPHTYLDTIVFLGSVANQQPGDLRWWWAGGAIAGSFLWFAALGLGSRLLKPFFAKPSSWRVLDGLIAVVMTALGLRLLLGA